MVTLGSADLGLSVNTDFNAVQASLWIMPPGMDELRTWADLKRAIDRRRELGEKIVQSRLAEAIPIDPSQLSRQLKKKGALTVSQARAAEAFLKGEALVRMNGEAHSSGVEESPPLSQTRLPVYGYAVPGDEDRFVLDEEQILEERELPMGFSVGPGDYFIVLAPGSSMEPRVVAGEPQVVFRKYPPARDKKVVVEFTDGTAVVKNFKGWKDDRLWVEQFNPPKILSYPRIDVKALHAVVLSF